MKWLVIIVVLFFLALAAAFQLSPRPGVFLVSTLFNLESAKVRLALEKHAPHIPITIIPDQPYRSFRASRLFDKTARLDVYYPQATATATAAEAKLPLVIWTHGGAWMSGDKTDAAPYFKLLAAQGYAVIAVDYALAPDKKYPAPLFQLNDAYSYIRENAARFHADIHKIILAGDSAGAQLSAQMAAIITNPAYSQEIGIEPALAADDIRGVVLYCGIYKMENLIEAKPLLSRLITWGSRLTVWAYSGTRNFTAPIIRQMSPYYHVTAEFPPTYISGGNGDPLTDKQSRPFADKLRALGVPVRSVFYAADYAPALLHEYQFNLDQSAGQQTLASMLAFVRKHIGQKRTFPPKKPHRLQSAISHRF